MPELPEIPNADMVVPLLIMGICALLMVLAWAFTRPKPSADDLNPELAGQQPIVGQSRVTQAQLGTWHRAHGAVVQQWIENHENVLRQVADDSLAINLNDELRAGHTQLGPAIDQAIEQHPAAPMRAQLSALVLASRGTIEALRRSNWSSAESEHLAYLEYRDTWLDRLRQFATAESQVHQIRDIGSTDTPLPSWLEADDAPPG